METSFGLCTFCNSGEQSKADSMYKHLQKHYEKILDYAAKNYRFCVLCPSHNFSPKELFNHLKFEHSKDFLCRWFADYVLFRKKPVGVY